MRVSEYYNLGRSQSTLEFLDVDINGDTRAFIDPRALRYVESPWARECVSLIQDFFTRVVDSIRDGDHTYAHGLLASLSEPNETHLGLSKGNAAGRGMGNLLARELWNALRQSRAVQTGLLQDLEETALFIEGVAYDRISDITTNIIRGQLVDFTQQVCSYYNIPLTENVVTGRCWSRQSHDWTARLAALPRTTSGRLLLVPKSIVRVSGIYDPGEYYRDYVLPYLENVEREASSGLVHLLKSGGTRVYRKDLRRKYGSGKPANLKFTLENPALLDEYRAKKAVRREPPTHASVSATSDTPPPDWDGLLDAVVKVAPGPAGADAYHRAVEALLTALLYPALDFPQREFPIHQGRKRIDINYTNVADHGFFQWLHSVQQVPCSQVPVECKNYSKELKNPEFDQLAGRLSIQRGQVGFLCHRGFHNKTDVVARGRDAALDGRGYIIALDDEDLRDLVEVRKNLATQGTQFEYLLRRFQQLI